MPSNKELIKQGLNQINQIRKNFYDKLALLRAERLEYIKEKDAGQLKQKKQDILNKIKKS